MKRSQETVTTTYYQSEVLPDVRTENAALGEIIAWADANPVVWKIVTENRSKVFGKNANLYYGYERGGGPEKALLRAARFKEELERVYDPPLSKTRQDFWSWRARWTLENYAKKGFKSGYFQEWDEKFARGCTELDYNAASLEEAIDRFLTWCRSTCPYDTKKITVDGRMVRAVEGLKVTVS